jgi:O-antigen ligase
MKGLQTFPSQPQGVRVSYAAGVLERSAAPFTRWALYAWLFSLPFDVVTPTWLPTVLQGNLSIPRMAGILLTLCFLADPQVRPWRFPPAALAIGMFFIVFTTDMMRSDLGDLVPASQQFQLVVLLFICYNLFLDHHAVSGALFSFATACATASGMVLTGLAQNPEEAGRLYAFGSNPNLYAELLGVGVLVAIGLGHIRQRRGVVRLPIIWGMALIILVVIARSGSRGQTLGLAAGLVVFILRRGNWVVKLRNVALMAIIAGVAYYFFSHADVLQTRWLETWQSGGSSGRDVIYSESWAMVCERPILGWGGAATRELANRLHVAGAMRSPHNHVLGMLMFTGLVGSIPYFWAYFKVLRCAWRARRGMENVLPLAIFVTLFIGDAISGELPGKLHWTFFAYMLAAGTLCRANGQESRTPQGRAAHRTGGRLG